MGRPDPFLSYGGSTGRGETVPGHPSREVSSRDSWKPGQSDSAVANIGENQSTQI